MSLCEKNVSSCGIGAEKMKGEHNIYIYIYIYIYIGVLKLLNSGIYFYVALSERLYKVDAISRTCDVSRALETKLAFSHPPLSKFLKQSFCYGEATNGTTLRRF